MYQEWIYIAELSAGVEQEIKTSPNESRELRVVLPLLSSLRFPEKLIVPKKILVSPTKQTIHSSNFDPRHTICKFGEPRESF